MPEGIWASNIYFQRRDERGDRNCKKAFALSDEREGDSSVEPDVLPIIEAIATDEAPIVENPDTDETLTDETGMNTQEAFLIAQQRGYKGNSKSFRDRFDKQDMAKDFGLRRVPHKKGRENWLYFDTKS